LVEAKAALTDDQRQRYFNPPFTVGSAMIWPLKMGPPMSLNRARGWKWQKIADRMDLTLESIRRYYAGRQESPLLENLAHYSEFFDLFDGFREFVDFFHFQDLVTSDYSEVRFFLPCEDFTRAATPRSVEEYVAYREATFSFIDQRQSRMADWVRHHQP
jgi:transcriptional regulator with XRE-family HTH domain